MSEAFVDVTWRGLEVGKRVKLHAIHAGDAYIDHTTPMPVGTVLALQTDEGVEIAATVVRVHEQVGGSNEVPGMLIKPHLTGAAAQWWDARREASPPPPRPASDSEPPPMGAMSPAALAARRDDPRAAIASKPTLTMSTVEVERALAAVKNDVPAEMDAGNTEVMAAVDDATLAAIAASDESSDSNLVDDGKRTMVMSAVDVNAIVEAADAEADVSGGVNGDEPSGDGGPGDSRGGQGKKRRGKRRKGRRD